MTRQLFIKRVLQISCVSACAASLASPVYAQYSNDRYQQMDDNNDGVISRSEWRGSDQSFRRYDWNNDGVLSGDELRVGARRRDSRADNGSWRGDDDRFRRDRSNVTDWTPEEFDRLDSNRDGVISEREWRSDDQTFARIDRNTDGVLDEREFIGDDTYYRSDNSYRRDGSAYRAGEDRGLTDGRKAGREDKVRRNAWDLDGQRELEQADAGYQSSMGPREDYQEGYRDGFVQGYREGFGPR